MKRFATSGDYSDVCYRSLQMWDLSTAWSLSSGSFASTATTESLKESMGVVATLDSGEIYVRANAFQAIAVSQFWISATVLRIPSAALWEAPQRLDFLIDQNAITPLQHCADAQPDQFTSFRVQRSTH